MKRISIIHRLSACSRSYLTMWCLILLLTLPNSALALIYDDFNNNLIDIPAKWTAYVTDKTQPGSYNNDNILSESGGYLNVDVSIPSLLQSPYEYVGRLRAAQDILGDFSVSMKFDDLSISQDFLGQVGKQPNIGVSVSLAPGYGIRMARFVTINSTPGSSPGPVNQIYVMARTVNGVNVDWLALQTASSDDGIMELVRHGSYVDAYLTENSGVRTLLYSMYDPLYDTATPLGVGIYAQIPGSLGSFHVGIDWVDISSTPVPEPTTMLLLASGLVGLAAFRKVSSHLKTGRRFP